MKKNMFLNNYDYVDPLIDTGKPKVRWVFFQSASCPFGMIQLSPDTDVVGTWGTGYRYYSKRIKCFSHLHQWQLSGIAILPIQENIDYECKITAELTATYRVGFHKYTFNKNGKKSIMLDLISQLGPSEMLKNNIKIIDEYTLSGFVENDKTLRRPKPCKIFFHIVSDQKFKLTKKDGLYFLNIKDKNINQVQLKVAISYVSEQNAKLNMDMEIDHFDFTKTKSATKQIWIDYLNKVNVKSKNKKYLIKFYSDLWRISMGGHIISDVNNHII